MILAELANPLEPPRGGSCLRTCGRTSRRPTNCFIRSRKAPPIVQRGDGNTHPYCSCGAVHMLRMLRCGLRAASYSSAQGNTRNNNSVFLRSKLFRGEGRYGGCPDIHTTSFSLSTHCMCTSSSSSYVDQEGVKFLETQVRFQRKCHQLSMVGLPRIGCCFQHPRPWMQVAQR